MAHLKTQLHCICVRIAHLGYLLPLGHRLTFPNQNGFIVRIGRDHTVTVLQNDQIPVATHVLRVENFAITSGNHGLPRLAGDIDTLARGIKTTNDLALGRPDKAAGPSRLTVRRCFDGIQGTYRSGLTPVQISNCLVRVNNFLPRRRRLIH